MTRKYRALPFFLLLLLAGCWESNEEPRGLRRAEPSGGPRVNFDLDIRPFPDIPFPNDVATRADASSPTGLRLNISEHGASQAEERVRRALNELSGFGVFSPITVSFDKPLDVEDLIRRHQQKTPDFSDDAVFLVNVDPKSPNYGKLELLDMGLGNYPITLSFPNGYYDNDEQADGTNLLFPTEDHHRGEPNLRTPGGDPWEFGQVLDFYERETNTLIIRPVHTLEPGTTYAVVLSSALRGEDGRMVDSPFVWSNHLDQSRALEPLRQILPEKLPDRFGPGLKNVRFAWSFTTQVPTERLEAIRAGLYGAGPLAWLAEEFPAELHMIHSVKDPRAKEPLTFDLEPLLPVIIPIANQELGSAGTALIREVFQEIDYVVSGTFLSPNFLGPEDGLYIPELARIDLESGEARVTPGEVPFMCSIPRAVGPRKPPFPVIIYSHAIGSTRFEMLIFAGSMAKFGFATCTIDAAGHGVALPPEFKGLVEVVGKNQNLPNLEGIVSHHRARDLDNDGQPDSGADYFSADVLHSRDMITQTAIDQMQFVRILRSFDGKRRFPDQIDEDDPFIKARRELVAGWDQTGDGKSEIAGDFNGDGTVDLGGERPYAAWGTSLGGIQASLLAASEPLVVAAASNAGGGGLSDIASRTTIGNVRAGVILRMMGPLLIGRPIVNGAYTRLDWILPEGNYARRLFFIDVPALQNGDRVVLRNKARERNFLVPWDETYGEATVLNSRFRVSVAADAVSTAIRRQEQGFDASIDLYRDIMGCVEAKRCGDSACEESHYCAPDNSCQPLSSCQANFDPALLSDEEREEYERRLIEEPTGYGDPLVIEIYGASGDLKYQIDYFPRDTIDLNMLYPKGAPLAAIAEGWGLRRQTPRFRSFIGIAQTLLEPADPAVWAPHFHLRPLHFPYEAPDFQRGSTNFLTIGTLGDQLVPINSAINIARAAGILETMAPNPAYGMPDNQFLIENFVYEGISHLDRFPDYPNTIFDPDNLDEGLWRPKDEPDLDDPKPFADPPVRATVETDYGVSALRFGYLRREGEHTFNAPDPSQPFDISSFLTNQVGFFLGTGGKKLSDDHCLEDLLMRNCSFFNVESFENPL